MSRSLFSVLTPLLAALECSAPISAGELPLGEVLATRLTDDTWQIWQWDLVTGEARQLTFSAGDKRYPGWTPDGRVFFQTANQGCFVLSEEGQPEPVLEELWPLRDVTWSPDGSTLLFARIRTDIIDAANIWRTGLDGSDRRALTDGRGMQSNPAWSPDGRWLAYVDSVGWGTDEIWRLDRDGGDALQLTSNRDHDFLPSWSPDGSRVAFTSDRSGDYELWSCAADGSDPRQVTRSPGLDTRAAWSPDGTWMAFTTNRTGQLEVWYTSSDGSIARPLLRGSQPARDPAWRSSSISSEDTTPFLVREVALSRKVLEPGRGEPTRVRCRLSHPGAARIDIVDEQGYVLRRLAGTSDSEGRVSVAWDGTGEGGEPLSPGVYRYIIVAEDGAGRTKIHDPSTGPWGGELTPRDFVLDHQTGLLSWTMPKSGWARLRSAVQGFPLLGTPMDWVPLAAGPQEYEWHGYDESGLIKLLGNPQLWINLELVELPANTIIVQGESDRAATPPAGPSPPTASYAPLIAGREAYRAARKSAADRRAPRVDFDFPDATDLDPQGRPILTGKTPVRVWIDERDAASMVDSHFEIALYIDLVFYYEDEESTTPLTYVLDTSELTPGPHLITANAFGFDGRIGTLTRSVVIGGEQ